MMVADIWVSTLFKLGLIAFVVHLSLTKILPLIETFLSSVFKEKKTLGSLTSLIGLLILILAGKEALVVIAELNNAVLNYALALGPALTVLSNLISYLQYIILAVLLVMILKAYKK